MGSPEGDSTSQRPGGKRTFVELDAELEALLLELLLGHGPDLILEILPGYTDERHDGKPAEVWAASQKNTVGDGVLRIVREEKVKFCFSLSPACFAAQSRMYHVDPQQLDQAMALLRSFILETSPDERVIPAAGGVNAFYSRHPGCMKGVGKRATIETARGASAGLFWDPTYTSTGGIRAGVQPHDGGSTSSSSGDEYDLMMGSGGVKQQRSNQSRGNAAGKAPVVVLPPHRCPRLHALCLRGDAAAVKETLLAGRLSLAELNEEWCGETPLACAVRGGSTDIMELLVGTRGVSGVAAPHLPWPSAKPACGSGSAAAAAAAATTTAAAAVVFDCILASRQASAASLPSSPSRQRLADTTALAVMHRGGHPSVLVHPSGGPPLSCALRMLNVQLTDVSTENMKALPMARLPGHARVIVALDGRAVYDAMAQLWGAVGLSAVSPPSGGTPCPGQGGASVHNNGGKFGKGSAARAVVNKLAVVGLDTETKPKFHKGGNANRVDLVQIATADAVFLFRVGLPAVADAAQAPGGLLSFLSDARILKVGAGIKKSDVSALQTRFPTFTDNNSFADLDVFFRQAFPSVRRMGLQGLLATGLSLRLSKTQQMADWGQHTYTAAMVHYAALDAMVGLWLFNHIAEVQFCTADMDCQSAQ